MNQTSHILNELRCAVIGIMLFALACSGCTKRDANRASAPPTGKSVSQPAKTLEKDDSANASANRASDASTDQVSPKSPEANPRQKSTSNLVGSDARSATGPQALDGAPAGVSPPRTNINDANSDSTTRVDDTSSKNNALDPRAAEARAELMIAEAEQAGQKGNTARAFELAVCAWEIVRVQTGDVRCEELAERALKLAEQFGEATNSNSAGVDRKRPVTVK